MRHILIIEDDVDLRETLEGILKGERYQVTLTRNGREGVEAARKSPPDLILCDIEMPELDGLGVLKQLRADPAFSEIPFVFLTALGSPRDMRAGMNTGADDYLTKPVATEDLLATLEARFARQQLHRRHASKLLQNAQLTPDFSCSAPLRALGITSREAEVLLWVAQGKTNFEIGGILGMSEGTVKKHMQNIFGKTGLENRNAAMVRALELLGTVAVK